MLFYHTKSKTFLIWFYHLTSVLVFTNSCINPFIYAAKYNVFKDKVRRLIVRVTNHQVQDTTATTEGRSNPSQPQ